MTGKGKAVVTGASSGIGRAIAEKLAMAGYEVFGIGRHFRERDCGKNDFNRLELDLLDTEKTTETIKKINEHEDVTVLVNCAGIGCYGLHGTLSPSDIQRLVRTNLEVPMILSGLLLKTLKQNSGYIINISSHTATQANPHGCAYGATKAGLSSFSRSLFEEERKYGLKVVNIEPDLTDTALYRDSDFGVDDAPDAYLLPEETADAVMFALEGRNGRVITNISLRPRINRIKRKKTSNNFDDIN